MDGVRFPISLQHLEFGSCFNQSLDQTLLPNLLSLTLGDESRSQELQQCSAALKAGIAKTWMRSFVASFGPLGWCTFGSGPKRCALP